MSVRRVKLVLLCEDSQHEAFARRFLEGMGWNTRELRVEKSPSAGGAAEQWVRNRFPVELKIFRERNHRAASGLVAIIDADTREVYERINELESVCRSTETPFRQTNEAVAVAVPRRNIETWIHYLNGTEVNENDDYPKLERERGCRPAVAKLISLCRSTGLPADAPPSLGEACKEYQERIRPLGQG